jgi:hypothetical protein
MQRDTVTQWHPIIAAVEIEPGHWQMISPMNERYAIIVLLEIRGERGYRVVTWAANSTQRRLVGYFRTLRAAAWAGHQHYLRGMGAPGPVNGR